MYIASEALPLYMIFYSQIEGTLFEFILYWSCTYNNQLNTGKLLDELWHNLQHQVMLLDGNESAGDDDLWITISKLTSLCLLLYIVKIKTIGNDTCLLGRYHPTLHQKILQTL